MKGRDNTADKSGRLKLFGASCLALGLSGFFYARSTRSPRLPCLKSGLVQGATFSPELDAVKALLLASMLTYSVAGVTVGGVALLLDIRNFHEFGVEMRRRFSIGIGKSE